MARCFQQGCVDVIQLDERLTLDEADEVSALLNAAQRERLPQVVVDLRRLRLLDSAGLELLSEARSNCMRRGGALRLAGASALVRDVLRVTGLEHQFAIDVDVVSAAGAFAK